LRALRRLYASAAGPHFHRWMLRFARV
jgi:hypothetical protein